ncbi:hypothetical protein BLOT_015231 [Blomia tropicalis]|nr:hypothetical protein BLOT_015231 [Blomia tropicalis]
MHADFIKNLSKQIIIGNVYAIHDIHSQYEHYDDINLLRCFQDNEINEQTTNIVGSIPIKDKCYSNWDCNERHGEYSTCYQSTCICNMGYQRQWYENERNCTKIICYADRISRRNPGMVIGTAPIIVNQPNNVGIRDNGPPPPPYSVQLGMPKGSNNMIHPYYFEQPNQQRQVTVDQTYLQQPAYNPDFVQTS